MFLNDDLAWPAAILSQPLGIRFGGCCDCRRPLPTAKIVQSALEQQFCQFVGVFKVLAKSALGAVWCLEYQYQVRWRSFRSHRSEGISLAALLMITEFKRPPTVLEPTALFGAVGLTQALIDSRHLFPKTDTLGLISPPARREGGRGSC